MHPTPAIATTSRTRRAIDPMYGGGALSDASIPARARALPVGDRRLTGPAFERAMKRLGMREAKPKRHILQRRFPVVEVDERQLASHVVELFREAGPFTLEAPAHGATAHVQHARDARHRGGPGVLD